MKFPFRLPLAYKFAIPLGGFLVLVIGGLFFWTTVQYERTVKAQLIRQAQSLFGQLVVSAGWVGEHATPLSASGKMVSRELYDIISATGGATFHLTSLMLADPGNRPDEWEAAALKSFETGTEYDVRFITREGKQYLNYFAPLFYQPTCGGCHSFPGYRSGDVRGGLGITFRVDEAFAAIGHYRRTRGVMSILTVAFALALLFYLLHKVILSPVNHLASVSERIRGGDMEAKAALATGDELQHFGETFNLMLGTIRKQRAELEDANRILEDRVRERTVRLEEALMELKELDRLKDSFISHAAHELRTPLTGAKGSLALLTKKSDLPDRDRELVAIVGRNIDRLIRLVRDMLDLGRIQRDEFPLSIVGGVDIGTVISGAVETIRPLADEAGISLAVTIPGDLPPIAADADRLVQVFLNLLDNAVKFARGEGPWI